MRILSEDKMSKKRRKKFSQLDRIEKKMDANSLNVVILTALIAMIAIFSLIKNNTFIAILIFLVVVSLIFFIWGILKKDKNMKIFALHFLIFFGICSALTAIILGVCSKLLPKIYGSLWGQAIIIIVLGVLVILTLLFVLKKTNSFIKQIK